MSTEQNCETIVMALLSNHASLSSFQVRHFVDDDDGDVNRIVVKGMPEETLVPPIRPDLPPAVSRVPVHVTVRSMSQTDSQMDTVVAAVKEAMDSAPAGVITTATGLFPNGFKIEDTDDGTYEQTDNRRTWEKVYNAVIRR
jgi:hypothetical protein